MRALITNDDGIGSRGLRVLARAAVAAGLDVTVAAPDSERSGSGAALSALEPGGRRSRPAAGKPVVRGRRGSLR